jgi:hypothetical protein
LAGRSQTKLGLKLNSFFAERAPARLGLIMNSLFNLAGKLRLFFFPEQALSLLSHGTTRPSTAHDHEADQLPVLQSPFPFGMSHLSHSMFRLQFPDMTCQNLPSNESQQVGYVPSIVFICF